MAQIAIRASATHSPSSIEQKGIHRGHLETTDLSCHALNNEASSQGGQKGHHGGPFLRARAGKTQLNIGVDQLAENRAFLRNGHPVTYVSTDSWHHDVKVHAERASAEARATTASENLTAASQSNEGQFTRPKTSRDSPLSNKQFMKGAIAVEAATHFKQFETVLQVLESHEKAVKAEVRHSDAAQVFHNGTWPVLLGLAQGSAATKGSKSFEVHLQEIQAESSANDASWALEKAEMEAKLEKMSREVANLEALLRDLQREALTATQTAGPWQGEEADGEERAWWQPARMLAESAWSSASTSLQQLNHAEPQVPNNPHTTRFLPVPQATPAAFPLLAPQSHPHTTDAQLRTAEQPPLLAAEESLTRRLSELRGQVAQARGAPRNPFESLGLRALETLRKCGRGGAEILGGLSETARSLQGRALPMIQKGPREAQLVVGAVVFAVALAAAGGLVRRAYRHQQEVRIVAMRMAAEEQLREMQGTVVDLNVDNFVPVLTTRPTIVKFYTDWCPYCKRMAPTWEELAKRISEKGLNVQVARLNADVYSEPVMDLNLKGFPSLVLFQGTKPILNYTGPRDIDALLGVVEASYGQAP